MLLMHLPAVPGTVLTSSGIVKGCDNESGMLSTLTQALNDPTFSSRMYLVLSKPIIRAV